MATIDRVAARAAGYSDAEIDFEASLKFAPNRLSTIINLSIVLIKLNKLEKAENLIKIGLLYHPKNQELSQASAP
jgi:predicted Zn-dependent protease